MHIKNNLGQSFFWWIDPWSVSLNFEVNPNRIAISKFISKYDDGDCK